MLANLAHPSTEASVRFPAKYPARDRRFLQELADELRLAIAFDEFDENDEPIIVLRLDENMVHLMLADHESELVDRFGGMQIQQSENDDDYEDVADDDEDDGPGEAREAIDRVLAKYAKAPVLADVSESDFEDEYAVKLKEKMDKWKGEYYKVRL